MSVPGAQPVTQVCLSLSRLASDSFVALTWKGVVVEQPPQTHLSATNSYVCEKKKGESAYTDPLESCVLNRMDLIKKVS